MATGTKTVKGFSVKCPMCLDEEATVSLDLNNVRTLTCSACDGTFSPREAVMMLTAQLVRWQAVEKWVESVADVLAE